MRRFPGRTIVGIIDRQLAFEIGRRDRGAFLHVGLTTRWRMSSSSEARSALVMWPCPSAILSPLGVVLSFGPQFRSHDVGPQAVVQPEEAVRCVGIDPHAEDDAALRSCDHRGVGERQFNTWHTLFP
jgi:hypothetical protein